MERPIHELFAEAFAQRKSMKQHFEEEAEGVEQDQERKARSSQIVDNILFPPNVTIRLWTKEEKEIAEENGKT